LNWIDSERSCPRYFR